MGWVSAVLAVVAVVERTLPLAERLFPGKGQGAAKEAVVIGSAAGVGETILPGVDMREASIQAALKAKIAADVALTNLLQARANQSPGTPAPVALEP